MCKITCLLYYFQIIIPRFPCIQQNGIANRCIENGNKKKTAIIRLAFSGQQYAFLENTVLQDMNSICFCCPPRLFVVYRGNQREFSVSLAYTTEMNYATARLRLLFITEVYLEIDLTTKKPCEGLLREIQ